MNTIEKIRAEMKRQIHMLRSSIQSQGDYGQSCQIVAYENLLSFLDTLEEPDKDLPLPEDTLIFKKGVEEGRRLEREDVLTLIESRLSQIMGDAQPKPILRAELCDLLVQVKTRGTITKDEAIYKVLHQRADCLLRLRAERPQDWKGYYEGKFDGYTQAMQLLTETLESICIELEEQEHNDRQE